MTDFTLIDELGVIVWNNPCYPRITHTNTRTLYDQDYVVIWFSSSRCFLRWLVPYKPDLRALPVQATSFSWGQNGLEPLIQSTFDDEPLIQYKEYVFIKVDVLGKDVWMTPYDPNDEVQKRLYSK